MSNKTVSRPDISGSFVAATVLTTLMITSVAFVLQKNNNASIANPFLDAPSTMKRPNEVGLAKMAQPGAAQPYLLEIKEWGVAIPLPEVLKDAYYTNAGGGVGKDGLSNTVWISQTSLNATGCNITNTGPTEKTKPVGAIVRVLPDDTDPVKGTTYKQLYPNGVTIDEYYYAYKSWDNAKCASKASLQALNSTISLATKSTTKVFSENRK